MCFCRSTITYNAFNGFATMFSSIISIKNAQYSHKESVSFSIRKQHFPILNLLERLGYIRSYEVSSSYSTSFNPVVTVKLGYYKRSGLIRVLNLYSNKMNRNCTYEQLLKMSSFTKGVYVIATCSHGICSHLTALEHRVGGKILAYVE